MAGHSVVALSLVRYFRVINKVSEKPAAWFLAMIHHTGGHTPSILDAVLWELAILSALGTQRPSIDILHRPPPEDRRSWTTYHHPAQIKVLVVVLFQLAAFPGSRAGWIVLQMMYTRGSSLR